MTFDGLFPNIFAKDAIQASGVTMPAALIFLGGEDMTGSMTAGQNRSDPTPSSGPGQQVSVNFWGQPSGARF